jgi:ribosome-associated protein
MSETARKGATGANLYNECPLLWEDLPEEVRLGVDALMEKKVENIRVYDLRTFTPFFDFVLIGTVFSSAQAKVAEESVVDAIEGAGLKLWGIEGGQDSGWLLIDFWDVVVHLFRPEVRRYYNLEALWADLPWWPGEMPEGE